ncbi:MAG: hypothetical protein HC763_27375 [Hydrococcus sp. CRU_1_1]|nr:hypothetical protein [Hydrococcus sp. CRU_1_1]
MLSAISSSVETRSIASLLKFTPCTTFFLASYPKGVGEAENYAVREKMSSAIALQFLLTGTCGKKWG